MSKKVPIKKSKSNDKIPVKKKSLNNNILIIILLAITFITFYPTLKNNFVNWDDDKLVYQNPDILNLNASSIKTYFSTYYANMYHPLTTLSFAIDASLFGMNPMYFHLINILLHLINVVLAFYLVFYLTRKQFMAFIIAFLFALHPMHVESVVWIAERKDVLYTAFFLLSLIFYCSYLEKAQNKKFLLYCFAAFLLSLLSKSAAVTLPLVLLVIDFYKGRKINKKTIIEKVPFFLLSFLFGILSISSQHVFGEGSVSLSIYNITDKIFMASYSVCFYLIKFFVPFRLSAVHPLPVKAGGFLPLIYYLSMMIVPVLAALLYFLFRNKKKQAVIKKEIIFGLLFFLVTISLIVSLPVGRAVVAERYTYVPYIGMAFIVVSLTEYYNTKFKDKFRILFIASSVIVLGIFAVVSFQRCKSWKSSIVLFSDVINKYPDYPEAYNNRGLELFYQGKNEEADKDYSQSIRIKKDYAEAYFNHGLVFMKTANFKKAINKFDSAIVFGLNQYSLVFDYRGRAKFQLQNYEGAMKDYTSAININAFSADAYNDRGILKGTMHDNKGAISDFEASIKYKEVNPDAYFNRGFAYFLSGNINEACSNWQTAASQGNSSAPGMLTKHCNNKP